MAKELKAMFLTCLSLLVVVSLPSLLSPILGGFSILVGLLGVSLWFYIFTRNT